MNDNLNPICFSLKADVTMYFCGTLAIVVRTTLLLACHYWCVYFLSGPVDFGANEELMFRWWSFPLINGRGSLDVFFSRVSESLC